ncbi:MAG: hypothetical protein ACR2PW_06595 [Gammaproteobacteria bacterium]
MPKPIAFSNATQALWRGFEDKGIVEAELTEELLPRVVAIGWTLNTPTLVRFIQGNCPDIDSPNGPERPRSVASLASLRQLTGYLKTELVGHCSACEQKLICHINRRFHLMIAHSEEQAKKMLKQHFDVIGPFSTDVTDAQIAHPTARRSSHSRKRSPGSRRSVSLESSDTQRATKIDLLQIAEDELLLSVPFQPLHPECSVS